jgi:hypothetical protein
VKRDLFWFSGWVQVGFPVGDVRVRRAREREKERAHAEDKEGRVVKNNMNSFSASGVFLFLFTRIQKKVQPSNLFADKFHGREQFLPNA